MNYVLLCNASSDPMDVNEMSVGNVILCVIFKVSIDPTFNFPKHTIPLVTAVNMRVTYQVSLMPKQAAPAPKHVTSDLLCLVCVYCVYSINEWISIMAPAVKCENMDMKRWNHVMLPRIQTTGLLEISAYTNVPKIHNRKKEKILCQTSEEYSGCCDHCR